MLITLCTLDGTTIAEEPSSTNSVLDLLRNLSLVEAQQLRTEFLKSATGAQTEKIIELAWIYGLVSYLEEDYQTSIGHLSKAIDDNPDSAEFLWLRALAFSQLHDKRAVDDCHKALTIDPSFVPARLTLARVVADSDGGALAALRIICEVREQNANHGDSCFERFLEGSLHLKVGRPDLAIERLNESLSGSSTYFFVPATDIWLVKSEAHAEIGELASAIYSARRASESNKTAEAPLWQLFLLHRKAGNNVAALESVAMLTALQPQNIEYLTAKLVSYWELEEYVFAEREAQKILAIDPNNRLALKCCESLRIAISKLGDANSK